MCSELRMGAVALMLVVSLGMTAGRVQAQQEEATATAPDQGASGRATAFRAVSGARTEQVSGLQLMVAAYGLIWFLVLAYVVRLAALQAASEREQRRLERLLATEPSSHSGGD